ncbi:MAG: GyrI-like domain-containing protein [Pseudomonadota bacterium]
MAQSNYTLNCIERAVEFISKETHGGRTPQLETVADAAGLSKFHFNRIYKLATGETPQETLTRFRLAQAAERLRDPDVSVTDAAFSAGFGSSQAFAKAMKRVLSTSASSMRGDADRLAAAIETLVAPQQPEDADQSDLVVEIAQIEPFKAIALRTDGTYPSLNATYWALFEAAGDPSAVQAILGRPYGGIRPDETETLRFDCALKLTEEPDHLPDSIIEAEVEGGVYLLTRHVGSYDQLPDAVDRLYLTALSQSDLRISDEPMLFHYLDDPETTAETELRTDLYLPFNL